ncbi:MAG TPA: phosphoribosylamine--glycine ligase [Clostridiaceae bacterium]|nr:phosphoribosylamine--glycine ligase [Clostridiaceae bacterium]
MKVLVVGGGGREHAIIWKIKQNPTVEKVYCAPGNGGISELAECVPIKATDIDGMVEFAKSNQMDLVVVSPDDPLGAGMVDALQEIGIRAFGPVKAAAEIESSKAFAKWLMKKYNIPTAEYEVFDDCEKAIEYLKKCRYPIVIKADGLAAGKGVVIAEDFDRASEVVRDMIENRMFGEAGRKVVIEEFLKGTEVSALVFTDGKTIEPMVSAQDHKKVFDNDLGPNTGGMGAFSPSRVYTPELAELCMERIITPTVEAMNKEGRTFKGVLYCGLIITEEGPKVLEFNARFGDPETQVILPRLKTDLVDIFNAIIDERLDQINIEWDERAAACVILASGGYPGKYEIGYEIKGIDVITNKKDKGNTDMNEDVLIFHAGTRLENGKYYTSGGRVLGVTALGGNLESAVEKAYKEVEKIHFHNMHYRKDIGRKKESGIFERTI